MKLDHLVQIVRKMYKQILCPQCKEVFEGKTMDVKYFDEKEIVCVCKCTKCRSKVTMRANIKVNMIHKRDIVNTQNKGATNPAQSKTTKSYKKSISPESVKHIAKEIKTFGSKNISDLFQ